MPYKICQKDSNYLEAPDKTGIIATTDDPLYCHYIKFELTASSAPSIGNVYSANFTLTFYSKKQFFEGLSFKTGQTESETVDYFLNLFSPVDSTGIKYLPINYGYIRFKSDSSETGAYELIDSIELYINYNKTIYFKYHYINDTTEKIKESSRAFYSSTRISISATDYVISI